MSVKEKEPTTFEGLNKKIFIRPIQRAVSSLVSDPNHENYFLFGAATVQLSLPGSKDNSSGERLILVNPFQTKDERIWLEKELEINLNHLAPVEENFWESRRVILGKGVRVLDLKKPYDYIDYLILLKNPDLIAVGGANKFKRPTYRFVLEDEDFEIENKANKFSVKKEAIIEYAKIETNREKLVQFLKVYGKTVSESSKLPFLQGLVSDIIEKDPNMFLKLVKDDKFNFKLLIEECVEHGVLRKEKRQYFQVGGDPLSNEGEPSTMENAVTFLSHIKNQEIVENLKKKLEIAKTR